MKRVLFGLIFGLFSTTLSAENLRMAVTTSFHNSGLADMLLPEISRATGVDIQIVVVGTGQALRLGQNGDVDVVLVHAKAAEEVFVADGHAPYRREIMYNDFVIVGPKNDPAQVAGSKTAAQSLTVIAKSGALFASRGDDSGTHKAELRLWALTDVTPDGRWYRETGSGMGATLNTAVGLGAYTLTDRASWLNFGNKQDLVLLFEGDPPLHNQYAFLPVSKARHPHVNRDAAQKVEDWLVSDAGQAAIGAYRLDGQQLFFPNAKRPQD